jgi:hypothetical protein
LNDAIRRDNFVGFKVDKLPILKDRKQEKEARKLMRKF